MSRKNLLRQLLRKCFVNFVDNSLTIFCRQGANESNSLRKLLRQEAEESTTTDRTS